MEKRSQLEEIAALKEMFAKALPDVWSAETDVVGVVYKEGVLSTKTKRLIALGVALGCGCEGCIISQTGNALNAGATRSEILETLGVAVAMRGTTGLAESFKVIKLLEREYPE